MPRASKKTGKKAGAASRSNPPGKRVRSRGGAKPGQTEVKGTRKIDQAIESKAVDYASTRDERMGLTKEEKKKQSDLLEIMDKKNLKIYPMADGRNVVVEETITRKAKVVSAKGDDPEEAA